MQKVPTRDTSRRAGDGARVAGSAHAAGGPPSATDSTETSLLLGLEEAAGVVAEDVLEAGVGPQRGLQLVGGADGAQPPLVHEADPVAECVGLLHVVGGQ